MKKIAYLLLVLISFSAQAQTQIGTKKSWPPVERVAFLRECVKSAKVNMGMDTARFYCYCMLEKVETKYPDPEQSAKELTAEKLKSPEWLSEIRACLKGYWGTKDREEFLSSCIDAAKSMGTEKATNYCECMLYKMELKYPDPEKTSELTEEEMQKPEWQKLIKGCLDYLNTDGK